VALPNKLPQHLRRPHVRLDARSISVQQCRGSQVNAHERIEIAIHDAPEPVYVLTLLDFPGECGNSLFRAVAFDAMALQNRFVNLDVFDGSKIDIIRKDGACVVPDQLHEPLIRSPFNDDCSHPRVQPAADQLVDQSRRKIHHL
jgi:hypothetical protein